MLLFMNHLLSACLTAGLWFTDNKPPRSLPSLTPFTSPTDSRAIKDSCRWCWESVCVWWKAQREGGQTRGCDCSFCVGSPTDQTSVCGTLSEAAVCAPVEADRMTPLSLNSVLWLVGKISLTSPCLYPTLCSSSLDYCFAQKTSMILNSHFHLKHFYMFYFCVWDKKQPFKAPATIIPPLLTLSCSAVMKTHPHDERF